MIQVEFNYVCSVMNASGSWNEWRTNQDCIGFWSIDHASQVVLMTKLDAVEKARYCLTNVSWVFGAKAETYNPVIHGELHQNDKRLTGGLGIPEGMTASDIMGLCDGYLSQAGIPEEVERGGDLYWIPTHNRVKLLIDTRSQLLKASQDLIAELQNGQNVPSLSTIEMIKKACELRITP